MVDNVNGLNALPIGATANNVPAHIQLLKDDLNGGSIIRRLTGAAIAALSAPEKVAGVVVYNTTTGTLQVYNGSAFVNIDAAIGVWQSYTPTLTASTTNPTNWTQAGRYTRIGDTVVASFKLTAGASMTAGTGVYYAALPVSADTTVAASGLPVGQARAVGFGASIWTPAVVLEDAGKVRFTWPANVAGGSPNDIAHNVPWAWASTDTIAATITYEAA